MKIPNNILLTVILTTSIISCTNHKKFIIPTDIRYFYPDTITSLTVKEDYNILSSYMQSLYHNTVDKEIPHIEVVDSSGRKWDLWDLCKGETIILAGDAYCSVDSEILTVEFPRNINKIDPDKSAFNIICLLIEYDYDSLAENLLRCNQFREELLRYYDNLFILKDTEAKKINGEEISRYYVNNGKIVTHIGIGLSPEELSIAIEIENRDIDCSTFDEWFQKVLSNSH